MSLQFNGNIKIVLPLNTHTGLEGEKVSLSCFAKVGNSGGDYVSDVSCLFAWNYHGIGFNLINASQMNVQAAVQQIPSNTYPVVAHNAPLGSLVHVALVFDKDDPDKRFMAINGIKYHLEGGLNGDPMNVSQQSSINQGSDVAARELLVQDYLFMDGYCFTDEDIEAIQANPTNPELVGVGAVGVNAKAYWSFDGDEGETVTIGDPGITISGEPSLSWNNFFGSLGTVTYGPRMSFFVEHAVPGDIRVNSSGRSISIPFKSNQTNLPCYPTASSIVSSPTIRIDGGDPVTIDTSTAYTDDESTCLFLLLDEQVSPEQEVTISAPVGWINTSSGTAAALVNFPVPNRTDKPSTIPDWPTPREDMIPVGTNMGFPMSLYWSPTPMQRNRARDMITSTVELHPDGTIKNSFSVAQIAAHSSSNQVDLVGYRFETGRWAFGWDDKNPTENPTVVQIVAVENNLVFQEVVEDRNTGDVDGKGKVRIFDVQFRVLNLTLASGVDSSTTTLSFNEDFSIFESNLYQSALYVLIDGEKMKVTAKNDGLKQVTVERGWDGTTAASHSSGASAAMRHTAQHGSIYFRMSSITGILEYENLLIYEPNDWDSQSEVRPIVLPPDNWYEPSFGLSRILDKGLGILRNMDSVPTFTQVSEIDHCSHVTEPTWNNHKVTDSLVFKSARPFDPDVSPYVYTFIPCENGEAYSAVLAENISSSDVAITITDGKNAPILYGQTLFMGEEQMRVTGLPASGDVYQVKRGIMGTTPASHTAGTFSVGWRIPMVHEDQWIIPSISNGDYNFNWMEIEVDDAVSDPLRYGVHLKNYDNNFHQTNPINGNPIADIEITFSVDVPANTAGPFSVSVTDPESWDYIADNMYCTLGSEILTVKKVDRSAHTIWLYGRFGEARGGVFHASGTTAQLSSNRILCQNEDGTSKSYVSPFWYNSIVLPTGVNTFLVHSSPDHTLTNSTSISTEGMSPAFEQVFTTNVIKTAGGWPQLSGVPFEWGPKLLTQIPHGDETWYWFTTPMLASNDLVFQAAKRIRDNLPVGAPGRKVIVEYSNEAWHPGWDQSYPLPILTAVTRNQEGAGTNDRVDFFILRSKEIAEIVRGVFDEVGWGDEVNWMIAWQVGGNLGQVTSACTRLNVTPDGFSVAPYILTRTESHQVDVFDACDDGQAIDLLVQELEYGWWGRDFLKASATIMTDYRTTSGTDPLFLYYEGGVERLAPEGGANFWQRQRDICYHPQMRWFTHDTHDLYRRVGLCQGYAQYMLGQSYKGSTGDGTKLWGMINRWNQVVGPGDGTSGSFDNTSVQFTPGRSTTAKLTESPDSQNESTRMFGFNEYQTLYFDAGPPSNPQFSGSVTFTLHRYGIYAGDPEYGIEAQ